MGASRRSPVRRGVGLGDSIWLVAATAAALATCRAFVTWSGSDYDSPWKVVADIKVRGLRAPLHLNYWVHLVAPFVLCYSLALIPIRWRRPRPPARRVLRQPGAVASLAVVTGLGGSLAVWAVLFIPGWLGWNIVNRSLAGPAMYPREYRAYTFGLTAIGHIVLANWVIFALTQRWRSEPSWIDRLGRACGWWWIVTLPINHWAAFILQ